MKNSKEDTGWFGERRGLYSLLLLGTALLIGAGYLLFGFSVGTEPEQDTLSQYEYDSSVTTSDSVSNIPALNAQKEDEDSNTPDETASDGETDSADETEDSVEETGEPEDTGSDTESAAQAQFASPLAGAKVMRAFQVDSLDYDETMKDWRTHAATDYAGQKGDKVTAIADGTVVEVGKDALHGRYVILSHADDLQTLYAGISKIRVEEGDSVTCGQTIARLGSAMPAESAQGIHLHVEATRAGEPVDVESFSENS